MRLVAVVLLAIGVAPPTLALHGRHLVDRLPRRSWFEDCCISFFPLCYDWNDARYTDLSRASHREVWLLDAAAVLAGTRSSYRKAWSQRLDAGQD